MADLLQLLQSIDEQLFFLFNVTLANSFFDTIMPFITEKKNWYVPGGILWILLMWKGGKEGRALGILVIFGILLADQISSSILKPLTERYRPCKVLEGIRLLTHCGSRYGFPSSHASNAAAVGTLFMLFYRRWTAFWLLTILLIGFSRVYLGVHYPFDVLCGWLLGAGIALLLRRIYKRYESRMTWLGKSRTAGGDKSAALNSG